MLITLIKYSTTCIAFRRVNISNADPRPEIPGIKKQVEAMQSDSDHGTREVQSGSSLQSLMHYPCMQRETICFLIQI